MTNTATDQELRDLIHQIAGSTSTPSPDWQHIGSQIRRRRTRRRLAVGASAVVVGALAIAPTVILTERGGNGSVVRDAAAGAPQTSASQDYGRASVSVLDQLSQAGVEYTVVADTSGAQVGSQEAVDLAQSQTGLQASAGGASATLAYVTTHQYGNEAQPDPTKASALTPALNHELAWIVTFTSVPEHDVSGRRGGGSNPGTGHLGTAFVFISATSPAAVLFGLSL